MATIGTAYVQVVPSTEGIGDALRKPMDSAGTSAGEAGGKSLGSGIKSALIKLGIGTAVMKTIKDSMSAGADYEQLTGGVQKIFGDSAKQVIANAKQAYTTAGVDANTYMQQVTSFSASLLQSVGGDTAQAAKIADMAIKDMADNANTYGTSVQDIQNAYQGFAKQNYTMLDNLKLGYGGTKSEMERLLADAEKISGIHYDINNLDDVYNAIHVIQQETGITGTTAKEAAQTFSGSFESMKAAATNFLTEVSTGGDVSGSLQKLAETASNFLFNNFIPMLGRIVASIPQVIIGGLKALTSSLKTAMSSDGISAIGEFISGIISQIPELVTAATTLITTFSQGIMEHLPEILNMAIELVGQLAMGIIQSLPQIVECAGQGILSFIQGLSDSLPQILPKAAEMVGQLIQGLVTHLPEVIGGAMQIGTAIVETLGNIALQLPGIALNMIKLFVSGIVPDSVKRKFEQVKDAIMKPIDTAKDKIKGAIDKIKSFFNVTLKFSGIKLPHINVGWNTSGAIAEVAKLLGLKGVPKFSVSWYAKGGIFDNPSLIGVGEAGPEAVLPINKLQNMVDWNTTNPLEIKDAVKEAILETSDVLGYAMGVALEGVGIQCDNREFGRVVRKVLA